MSALYNLIIGFNNDQRVGKIWENKEKQQTHVERIQCSKNRTRLRHHCATWHHARPIRASPEVELTRHGPTGMSVRTLNCYGLYGHLLKGSMEEVRYFNTRTERETPPSVHLCVSNSVPCPHARRGASRSCRELPSSPACCPSCQQQTRHLEPPAAAAP